MTLAWRPSKATQLHRDGERPDLFDKTIRDWYGSKTPIVLDGDDLLMIQAMALVHENYLIGKPNPFQELAELVEEYGDSGVELTC